LTFPAARAKLAEGVGITAGAVDEQMRWRITITLLVAAVLLVYAFDFGAHPSTGAHGFGMLVLAVSTALVIFNAVGVFALWKRYKTLGLVPLLLILGSCVAAVPAGSLGFDARIEHFRSNQARYDEIVSKVLSREIPDPRHDEICSSKTEDNYVAFRTPEKYRTLVPYLITSDREGTNTVAVRLVLCVMFPSHHRAYLWCSDGEFTRRLRSWEHIQAVINTNWCAIAD
jgi:hypothetical protein